MSDYEEIGARFLPEYYRRRWLHSPESLQCSLPLQRPHSYPQLHHPPRPRHLTKADLRAHLADQDHHFILDLGRFDSLGRRIPPPRSSHFLHHHLVSPT